jgi:hypothetical protein
MIKFFRKIRQKMLTQNRFSKYLIYAIGEIVLVMIGILLALQVNNWNEVRKNRKAEHEDLVNLKQEFESNYESLVNLLEKRHVQEKQYRDYIELITDPAIPVSIKSKNWQPNLNRQIWQAKNTVLNSLLNTGGINRIQNDSLKYLLTRWPDYIDGFRKGEVWFEESADSFDNYESSVIPGSIVKVGNYEGGWPGTYYPHNMSEKLEPIRATLINDFMYYNLIAEMINRVYIYLSYGTFLKSKYEQISQLIGEEIENRGLQAPDDK